MMCTHEISDLATEIHDQNKQEKYRHHQCPTIGSCPVSKGRMIRFQILGLEYSESSYNDDEEYREYTRLWDTIDSIDGECLAESLLEHLESGEEDDEESDPLDARIFDQ